MKKYRRFLIAIDLFACLKDADISLS